MLPIRDFKKIIDVETQLTNLQITKDRASNTIVGKGVLEFINSRAEKVVMNITIKGDKTLKSESVYDAILEAAGTILEGAAIIDAENQLAALKKIRDVEIKYEGKTIIIPAIFKKMHSLPPSPPPSPPPPLSSVSGSGSEEMLFEIEQGAAVHVPMRVEMEFVEKKVPVSLIDQLVLHLANTPTFSKKLLDSLNIQAKSCLSAIPSVKPELIQNILKTYAFSYRNLNQLENIRLSQAKLSEDLQSLVIGGELIIVKKAGHLGKGAFSKVTEISSPILGASLALKEFNVVPAGRVTPKEVKLLRLIHGNTLQVGIQPPVYVVTDHLNKQIGVIGAKHQTYGTFLEEQRTKQPNINARVSDALQLLKGLETCHKKGVFHDDIKPANILFDNVNGFNVMYLADFDGSRVIPVENATNGDFNVDTFTPEYRAKEPILSSPEDRSVVLTSEKWIAKFQAGIADDIFSLGCVFYNMFSSKDPFQYGDRYPIFGTYRPLQGVPKPIATLIADMLSEDPLKRPSIKEAGGVLVRYLREADPSLVAKFNALKATAEE